jgi:DNA-binding response OmpR family regulator
LSRAVNNTTHRQVEQVRLEASEAGVRVMIADDNLDHVATTSRLLQTEGYAVLGLASGTSLLEQFEAFQPQIVILDIGMPHLTGYEVARALRAHRKGSEVLLIALTGHDTQTDRMLSKLAGFDYHLAKPVDPNMLTAVIRDYLAGHRPVRVHVIPHRDDQR